MPERTTLSSWVQGIVLALELEGLDGRQLFAELGPAVSELRDTLAALRGISRRLEENPANYLLGREKTKEFTP